MKLHTIMNMMIDQISTQNITDDQLQLLKQRFGQVLKTNVYLARYTTARVGGPALAFLESTSSAQLLEIVTYLWSVEVPYKIIGGGSNLLISDKGVSCVVILNRNSQGKGITFLGNHHQPFVYTESGVNLNFLIRRLAVKGYAGLEWAVGIPGTVGGAIINNAGAHGSDMAHNLIMADILQPSTLPSSDKFEVIKWNSDDFCYDYRSSRLKQDPALFVILGAELSLQRSTPEDVTQSMSELNISRQRRQPSGASVGSMFKNPPGDYAGRLIEAAGLKGTRVGNAQISPQHANFFINLGEARSKDFYELICITQKSIQEIFGVHLDLEIQLIGEFNDQSLDN